MLLNVAECSCQNYRYSQSWEKKVVSISALLVTKIEKSYQSTFEKIFFATNTKQISKILVISCTTKHYIWIKDIFVVIVVNF